MFRPLRCGAATYVLVITPAGEITITGSGVP
jgi:hypothetical protein